MFVATINVPGYLPMDDEPPTFDTATAAWDYLAHERERAEDSAEYADGDPAQFVYSDTWRTLCYIASGGHTHGDPLEDTPTNADGTGVVYGGTPGSDSPHDLGLAYSVVLSDAPVHTWADSYGVWHVRVRRTVASPLIAARRALRDEITARDAHATPSVWLQPERLPQMDTPDTLVWREGAPE